jgi:beta-fructofuranosidase
MHKGKDGKWHLYYQYNPSAPVAGNQHWGHATSEDGYTWINQKIALWPPNNYSFMFSGSAVVDSENTSGFFPDQDNGVVAIYTVNERNGDQDGIQYQAISYSRDGGYTFQAFEGNPVLDVSSTQFRDPHVVWHAPSKKWVMTVAFAQEFVIGIYTSPDLKAWTWGSNFTRHGYLGVQYECPNLVQMPMRGQDEPVWVMFISLNPGGPRGGSVTEYFVGGFDGTTFVPFDDATRFTDFGKDNYAAQFFNNVPANEPQIAMGWASNWLYTNQVPTGDVDKGEFRSAMTIPRAHSIANISPRGYDLISAPFNIESVLGDQIVNSPALGSGTVEANFAGVASGAILLEISLYDLASRGGFANWVISSSATGEYLRGGIKPGGDAGIWIDRGNIRGFSDNPYFTDKFSEEAAWIPASRSWNLTLIYDNSIVEVFLNDAEVAGTLSLFPEGKLDVVSVTVGDLPDGASSSVNVWGLKDTWAPQANADGQVLGNVTAVPAPTY